MPQANRSVSLFAELGGEGLAHFTPEERAARRKRVAKLRVEGYTVNEIAALVKIGRKTVIADIEHEMNPANRRENNTALLEIELERLNVATKTVMKRVVDKDDFGNIYAVDRLLAIQSRRSQYLGLDASQRGTDHNDVDDWLAHIVGDDSDADEGVDDELDSEADFETED